MSDRLASETTKGTVHGQHLQMTVCCKRVHATVCDCLGMWLAKQLAYPCSSSSPTASLVPNAQLQNNMKTTHKPHTFHASMQGHETPASTIRYHLQD
jgi:hypothetical protein